MRLAENEGHVWARPPPQSGGAAFIDDTMGPSAYGPTTASFTSCTFQGNSASSVRALGWADAQARLPPPRALATPVDCMRGLLHHCRGAHPQPSALQAATWGSVSCPMALRADTRVRLEPLLLADWRSRLRENSHCPVHQLRILLQHSHVIGECSARS